MDESRPARTRASVLLHAVAGALTVVFAVWALVWPHLGPDVARRVLLAGAYLASMLSAVARCRRTRWRREELAMLVGVLASGAGSVVWALVVLGADPPPTVSVADLLWTALFPAVVLSLTMEAARGRVPQRDFAIDALIGASGAVAAVLAFVTPTLDGTRLSEAAAGIQAEAIYLAGDVALVLLVVTAISTFGAGQAPHLWSRLGGLTLFMVFDAETLAHGSSPDATSVASWRTVGLLVGFLLLETSVGWRLPRSARPTRRGSALVMPVMGVVLSLAVLASGRGDATSRGLAAVAIVIATVRMSMSFREVIALADSRRLALTDDLTGLPNRRAFGEAMHRWLDQGRAATIVMLDVDGFTEVNDALGHTAGDELLVRVAQRLQDEVAAGHEEGPDLVARFGGDQFAVLLCDRSPEDGALAARALVRATGGSFEIEHVVVQVSATAGVVHSPRDGVDLDELLRRADVAMYAAKEAQVHAQEFTEDLDTRGREWLVQVEQVREALASRGVEVHYQPKVSLTSGAVVGVEALARLRVDAELWMPGRFLAVVTKTGLLAELTEQVLDTALRDLRRWSDAGLSLSVAVNVCAAGVTTGRLPHVLRAALDREAIPGTQLVVEVTEHDLLADHASGQAVLDEVRAQGVAVSIDDYGTGYSSLAYLRDLPIDEIKLDRTFVAAMSGDLRGTQVVESTVRLAHRLGHRVVAEGVETVDDLAAVRDAGCDLVQGYLLARPMPAPAIEVWLAAWRPESIGVAATDAVPGPYDPLRQHEPLSEHEPLPQRG